MDVQGNAVEQEDFQPEFYCKHGTFVGSPLGGDYLCGYCEDGTTDQEFASYILQEEAHRISRHTAALFTAAVSDSVNDWPRHGDDDWTVGFAARLYGQIYIGLYR